MAKSSRRERKVAIIINIQLEEEEGGRMEGGREEEGEEEEDPFLPHKIFLYRCHTYILLLTVFTLVLYS